MPVINSIRRYFNSDNVGYLLIAPFYIFLFIFILVPIFANLFLSFTNYDLSEMSFVGFKNYSNLIRDQFFLISFKNTVVYTIFTLFLSMALGLMIALLLNQKIMGLSFFRTSFFIPHVTSMIAVSMMWMWIYEPTHGFLNQLLSLFGIRGKEWLFDVNYAMMAIIFMSVWKHIGYNMVIYLAGLQGIPKHLIEAATIDGANAFQRFRYIIFPMLRPVTFFLFIFEMINNFNVFEQIQIMTKGGPMNSTTTIVHQIYNRAFNEFHMGYAASISMVLLLVMIIVTLLNFKYGNQGYETEGH